MILPLMPSNACALSQFPQYRMRSCECTALSNQQTVSPETPDVHVQITMTIMGISFLRHKAGPPDEPRVDGRVVRCSTSRTHDCSIIMNTKLHVDKTLVLFCNLQVDKLIEPKNSKNSTENAQVLTVFLIDALSPLSTVSKSLTSASAINASSSSGQREGFRHWRSRRDQIIVDVNTPNDVATNLALLTAPLLLFRRWLLVTSKLPVRVM